VVRPSGRRKRLHYTKLRLLPQLPCPYNDHSGGESRKLEQRNSISMIKQYINALYGLMLAGAASVVGLFVFNNPVKFYEDFCRYYLMGKLASGPYRLSFYSLPVQAQIIIDFWNGPKFPYGLAFNTPPIVIPFVTILALFDLNYAYVIWTFLNAALFLVGTWLIMSTREVGSNKLILLGLIFAGTLASVPGATNAAEGQAAGIICGLIAIFFWAFQKKRQIVCGITLGLIIFKFQYLPFLLIPVLIGQRWKTLLFMTITDLLLFSATALAIGLPNILSYPAFVLKIETDPNYIALIDPTSMTNLKGLTDAVFPAFGLKFSFTLLCLALVLLAKIWFDAKVRKDAFPWAVSLTVLIALIFSPHTHNYDSILLVIPFLYACPRLSLAESFEVNPLPVKLWNVILVAMPVLTWAFKFMDTNPLGLKCLSQIVINCSLLLLAWLNYSKGAVVSSEEEAAQSS
jgi:hypothetical protein